MIEVDRYGLHWVSGLPFLVEKDQAMCLAPGMEAMPAQFKVRNGQPCPHNLIPAFGATDGEIRASPYLKAFAPIPDGGAYYIEDLPDDAAAITAGQNLFWPRFRGDFRKLIRELTLTNLAPLILTGFGIKDHIFLDDLNTLPRTRTLIFKDGVKKNWMSPVKTRQLAQFNINNGWRLLKQHVQRQMDTV
jgi:hypothetical protein